jgi:short-subunit dehydrogenase
MSQRRQSFRGARCLITGASSGLGRALAEQLAQDGARLVLTGRSRSRLEETLGSISQQGARREDLIGVVADLTDPADRERLFREIDETLGGLDLVVNSAGVGAYGQFHTHTADHLRRVIEINVLSLAEVCREALPRLAQGDQPVLINMGSIVARRGLPGRSEYSASKFAVTGFTEAIRVEWRRFGVHVLQVNPGFSDTAFDRNVVVDTARYPVGNRRTMSAADVARATLRAAIRGKREITLTPHGKLLLLTNRLFPRFVDWGFTRWLLRLFPESPILQTNLKEAATRTLAAEMPGTIATSAQPAPSGATQGSIEARASTAEPGKSTAL